MIRLQSSLKTMMVSDSQCDIIWLAIQHQIHRIPHIHNICIIYNTAILLIIVLIVFSDS